MFAHSQTIRCRRCRRRRRRRPHVGEPCAHFNKPVLCVCVCASHERISALDTTRASSVCVYSYNYTTISRFVAQRLRCLRFGAVCGAV